MDSPPTSYIEPSIQNFSQVTFGQVDKKHKSGEDITCPFTYNESFRPRKKDWIGIFKVGWKTTGEFYTYLYVNSSEDSSEHEKSVIFRDYYLPKDSDKYYQFCYVDENGEVRGVSVPFQILPDREMEEEDDMLMVIPEEMVAKLQVELSTLKEENASNQKTIEGLQTETEQLENEKKELLMQWESERIRNVTDNQTLEKEIKKPFEDKVTRLESDLTRMEMMLQKSQMEAEHEQNENIAQGKEVAKLRVETTMQELTISELKDKLKVESEKVKTLEIENENLQLALEEQVTKSLESEEERNTQLKSATERLSELDRDLQQQTIATKTHQNMIENLNSTITERDAEIAELQRQYQIVSTAQLNEVQKLNSTVAELEAKITELRGQIQAQRKMLETWKKKSQDELSEEQIKGEKKEEEIRKKEEEIRKKEEEIRKKEEEIRALQKSVEQWKDCFKKLEDLNKMQKEEQQEQKTRACEKEEGMHRLQKVTEQKLAALEKDFKEQMHRYNVELKKLQTINDLQESEIEDLKEERKNNYAEIVALNEQLSLNAASFSPSQSGSLCFGNPYEERGSDVFTGEQQMRDSSTRSETPAFAMIECPICKMRFLEYQESEMQDHLMCHDLEEEDHQ